MYLTLSHLLKQELLGNPKDSSVSKKKNVLLELPVQFFHIILLIQDGCYLAVSVAVGTEIKQLDETAERGGLWQTV